MIACPRMRVLERLRQAYLVTDLRSLALGRLGLAGVLIADLITRALVLRDFYSNEGLLPNHTLLWRPERLPVFSLFFAASSPAMAALGFALCGAVYLCLLVGYRTRLAQLLSWVAVVSLHARVFYNGGDIVLGELCLWTLFLPLGRRYSIDAALAARRAAAARALDPSASPTAPGSSNASQQLTTPAIAVVLGQLFFIYLLNAIHKNGVTWREGTAVHYTLHQDTIVTLIGLWVRSWITPGISRVLTWTTLGIEWTLPFLLISPIALKATRRAAQVLAATLHLGFVVFIDLQMFTPAMVAFLPFLLRSEDAAAFERWWTRRWAWLRARTPLGSMATTVGRALDALAAQTPRREPSPIDPEIPILGALARGLSGARRLALLALVGLGVVGLVADNSRNWHGPPWLDQAASYLQMYQRWSMFAPEAPRSDLNLSIDAVTVGGRHVDPFNEAASPHHPFPGQVIPPHLDQSPLFVEWALRIPWIPEYHQAFKEWMLRYHERTGHLEDRIVAFKAYVVEDDSPPPGERAPTNTRARVFFEYRE
ncbi:MAG TPA: HTTM domain-containing protein [Polyangia bacterium]